MCTRGLPGCPYLNDEHFDAHLTLRGRRQATAAGPRLLQTASPPEVVFVSPLSRTLQTATIALSKCPNLRVPVIAEELTRERNGVHPCDKRSAREHVEATYPTVDFSNIEYGPDPLWTLKRETEDELAARGKRFFLSLKDRPETTFAVFSHSSFLYNTITRSFVSDDPNGKPCCSPKQNKPFQPTNTISICSCTMSTHSSTVTRRFETGESRAVVLTYK